MQLNGQTSRMSLVVSAKQNTKKTFLTREQRDLLFGSLIGSTVVAIIATSAAHFVRNEPIGFGRILIGGISGGVGGLVGLFIISEMVGRNWLSAILLSLTVGVLDGVLIGVAVALFPSMF